MVASLQEEINKKAYELYERNGRRKGNELLDWLAAEKIVQFLQKIIPDPAGESIPLLEYNPASDAGSAASFVGKTAYRPVGTFDTRVSAAIGNGV
jgi:hypothetical protein